MNIQEHGRNGDPTVAGAGVSRWLPEPREPEKIDWDELPTVGLVTAIPEEFVAMRALLDGPVERFVAHDPALYVLGSLPSRDSTHAHRVALTLLGATATNAAANGCANMVRSFSSIAAVIMVGIAAGIPDPSHPERHVRLGDIVVATRGLVDYDHVRATVSGVQARRAFPPPSPRFVRCADILKADELSGHRPWESWLEPDHLPELEGYGRPPDHTDSLRDSAGRRLWHPPTELSGHRTGLPKVHHGSIGSADRSLRDGLVRDELAAQHEFIAVEMEGVGIGSSSFLNGLEWFVVRGVSDYGDSERDETWRRYASLVAAAYVRSLMAKCLPLEPNRGDYRAAVDSLM